MSEPAFTRLSGQPMFLLPLAGLPAGYGIAFLPNADPAADSLTLSATWTTNPGVYLFLGAAIADPAALGVAVRAYIGARATCFLWIANPGDSVAAWRASEIDLDPVTRAVSPPAEIGFRNFTLAIGAGCTVALNTGNDALVISAAAGATLALLTGFGSDSLAIDDTLTLAFSGGRAGALGFALALDAAQFAQLDAGCRYFFPDAASPVPGALASVRFPVLSLGAASVALGACLDPVLPLEPTRSAFYFLASPSRQGSAFASGFRTVYGEIIGLTPVASAAWPDGPALVFAVRPQWGHASDADGYYTTFEGPFSLGTLPARGAPGVTDLDAARMMLGYAGIEYAGVPAGGASQLAFVCGQPAFAPALGQLRPADNTSPNAAGLPLTPQATTAWCVLSPPADRTPLPYFAQPHDAVLYQATPGSDATPEAFLYYLEVFAGCFPVAAVRANAVPMVPFGLLDPAQAAQAVALETQTVSPYRRQLLTSILTPTESGPATGARQAATSQGLLLSLSDNLGHWKLLTLAQANGGTQHLQLASITGGLKSALQSNQLFTVVSNWQAFARSCTAVLPFALTAADWRFDLAPAGWPAHRTLVLLKYASGSSIDELAADTGRWSWPEAANGYDDTGGNLATTQADLRAIFAEAKAKSLTRPEFRPFVEAITSANWNGILFLRAPLATTGFPDQLRGIAAGIDPARLFAHHVGVAVAPVHRVGTQLAQEDASVFALIDYDDPVDLADTAVDYAFKVLGLTVGIANSAMASFSSRIELLVNRLFGSQTSQRTKNAAGNNIVLDGTYQSAGGTPAYVFVMAATSGYDMLGETLDSIDLVRAQFVTLTPTDASQATVQTRFVLDGRLRFRWLSDFDVFSFGPRRSADGVLVEDGHLFFSNLLVRMEFPAATPRQTSFGFDASTLAFDPSRSAARTDSLFAHFPLQLSGLLQAAPQTTPRDNGFTPVGSPLPNSTLGDPWFALTFDLALGSVGALAGSMGLVVQLVAGWSDGDTAPRTFVGLRLPGGGGSGAELMLQGVVGLTFRGIEFTAQPSAEGIDYMLRFRGISLRVLTLQFPPGQTDLCVFGDPGGGRSGVIGWYAAYAKKDEQKKPTTRNLASRSGRSSPP